MAPKRTLCVAADVVDVTPCAAFLSADPEDVPTVAVYSSAGALFETSWYRVPTVVVFPTVAVFLSSDVEDVPLVAAVVSAVVALCEQPGQWGCLKQARGLGYR